MWVCECVSEQEKEQKKISLRVNIHEKTTRKLSSKKIIFFIAVSCLCLLVPSRLFVAFEFADLEVEVVILIVLWNCFSSAQFS